MFVGIGIGINRTRFAGGFAGSYSSRVIADGGTIEALTCVNAASALLRSASLLIIPSGYKGGKLYSEIPTNGDGDFTWARASDAFRTNASGVIQRVPWNLLQQSEDLTTANWAKARLTITGNSIVSPDGNTTADTVTATAETGQHNLQNGAHTTTTITASIYAKKGTNNFLQIFSGTSSQAFANFNLNTGVVGTFGTLATASIQNVGNGWYRCIVTITSPSSGSTFRWALVTSASAVYAESWTATGSENLYLWGGQVVEGSSAQTYLPTTDRLGFPRLDYSFGSCPALLLEPQRTNLATWSEDFTNASWAKFSSSVTGNNTTAPDGNTTADRWTADGTFNIHALSVNLSLTNATTYTFSAYAKKDTNDFLQVYLGTVLFGLNAWANFNLNTGVVGSVGSAATASIQNVGAGWYRIIITATTITTGTNQVAAFCLISSATSVRAETNTLSTSVFLWGSQPEQGAYATTYISTTNAAATRLVDTFTRNNIYTNGLISASGGTWFVELRNNVSYLRDVASEPLELGDAGVNNGFFIRPSSVSSRLIITKRQSGVLSTLFTTTTDTVKIAIKWNGTSADVFVNGVKQVSATAFTTTIMENLNGRGNAVPIFIQAMALYPTPLSDAECQTLTT